MVMLAFVLLCVVVILAVALRYFLGWKIVTMERRGLERGMGWGVGGGGWRLLC